VNRDWLPAFILVAFFGAIIVLLAGFALQNTVLAAFGLGFFITSLVFIINGVGSE